MFELIVDYYQYYYRKVSGKSMFIFRPTNAEVSMINKFIDSVGSGVGEIYLFRYFSYQFYYWHDLDTKFGKGNIPIAWVIGKKAYDRYNDGKDEHWRSYSTVLFEKFDIRKSDLKIAPSQIEIVVDIPESEENDRMLYHNTDKGLIFCIDYTSQWHPKSKACSSCKFVNECMSIMKDKYSNIYNKRVEIV